MMWLLVRVLDGGNTACSSNRIVFIFNDPATTEIYTLSLHDALPICDMLSAEDVLELLGIPLLGVIPESKAVLLSSNKGRSEEHTSELQSQSNLVCRLLLEKKNASSRCVSCLSRYSRDVRTSRRGPST